MYTGRERERDGDRKGRRDRERERYIYLMCEKAETLASAANSPRPGTPRKFDIVFQLRTAVIFSRLT